MQDEEEEDDDDALQPPQEGAAAAQRPPPVNNRDGLASALEDFEWPRNTPWIDTLVVPVRGTC